MTDHIDSLLERAEALLTGGDITEAMAELDAAGRLAPADPRPHARRAELWIGRGGAANLRKAWLALVRALTLGLDSVDVHFQLMRALYELGEFDGAQAAYETALRLEPDNGRLREWAIRLAVAAGDSSRALALVRQERAAAPDNLHWQRWEIDLLLQTGAHAAAREALSALLDAHAPPQPTPNTFEAAQWAGLVLKRADVCRRLGDFDAALADLARAEAFMPGEPGVTFGRGLIAWTQGDPDAAFDLLHAGLAAAAPEVRAAFWSDLQTYPRRDALQAELGVQDDD